MFHGSGGGKRAFHWNGILFPRAERLEEPDFFPLERQYLRGQAGGDDAGQDLYRRPAGADQHVLQCVFGHNGERNSTDKGDRFFAARRSESVS